MNARTVRRPLEEIDDVLALGLRLPFVATVDDVLSADECAALVARIEAAGPEVATITRGHGVFELNTRIRNNDRVIFDDFDLARLLYERLGGAIPPQWPYDRREPEEARAVGLNERFRCYRYREGQRFAPHFDGCFARSKIEASEITVLVYLNDGCEGGETAILDYETKVIPKRGMALLFQHQILHEGCVVRSGEKYVLRSDVMYRADLG